LMAECPVCKNVVLVHYSKKDNRIQIIPPPRPTPTDPHIPEPVRTDLDEAKAAFSVGAYNATVVMCRRALQAAAILKGATKGKKLIDQIDELYEKEVITKGLRDLAHTIRLIGNEGAHPDPENPETVTREDAEEVLELTEQFLYVLFVTEAKVKDIRQKRGSSQKPEKTQQK